MRPLKLFITAFGPYAGTEVVDFRRSVDAGLFGIYGPTGSGKSSIFSAMAFALFGEGAKREQPTTSMRSGHATSQSLTEVALLFELDGRRYFVRRQPEQMRPKERGEGETLHKHTAFIFDVSDIEVDDVSIDNCGTVLAEKKVSLVDKLVTGILGYDVDQFRQIVLLPQGQFERFLASDSNARLDILRGLFDVSLYQRMTLRLHDQAKEARETHQQGMLLQAQQLTNAGFASTDDLAAAITTAEEQCTELDDIAATADAVRTRATTALAEGDAVQKMFDEAVAATAALAALQARQPHFDVVHARHTAAGRAAQLVDRDDTITRTANSLRTAQTEEGAAAARVAEAVKNETAAKATLEALKGRTAEIDGLKAQIVELDRFAAVLADAGDLKDEAESAEAALAAARTAASTAKAKAEGVVQTLLNHRVAVEGARGNETERGRLTSQRDRLQQALREAREFERAQSQLLLAKQAVATAEQSALRTRTQRTDLEKTVRDLQAAFIAGQARLLAERLEQGNPCPVCGSADHPRPAHGDEPAAGLETAWREAQQLLDHAAEEAQLAESALSSAQSISEERTETLAALGEPEASAADLDAELTTLKRQINGLGAVADLAALAERTRTLEAEQVKTEGDRNATADVEWKADTAAAVARRSYADHIAVVPEGLQDVEAIDGRRRMLNQQINQREDEIETAQATSTQRSADRAAAESDRTGAARRVGELEQALIDARAAYEERRDTLGLTDEEYRIARSDIANMATMADQLVEFRDGLTRAQGRVDDTDAAIADRERPDLDSLRQASTEAHASAQSAAQEAADARAKRNELARLLDALRAQIDYLARLETETGPLRALADAFEGRNPMNITLETYAVGAMFDQVLEAANLRFGPMSQGRYRLERDIQTVGGRKKRGLDIRVHDIQTGRPREVSTLSGGETFIAALALALGLSDIVEMSHGAIRLDTIFIDEGFGSLDSDSDGGTLDQVLQVLQDIVGQRRAVGLISHVPLVQQAVPNGFTVIKTPSGSRIEERIV
jgi:DNA repair protein SbcC/Rad50